MGDSSSALIRSTTCFDVLPGTQAVTAHEGLGEADEPAASPHERLAHAQLRTHVPSCVGDAVGRTVRTEAARIHEGSRVAAIRFDAARPSGVHGGKVGVRHDNLMTKAFEVSRNPLALGARLKQNPRAWPATENNGKPVATGVNP